MRPHGLASRAAPHDPPPSPPSAGALFQRCEDVTEGLETMVQVLRFMARGLDEVRRRRLARMLWAAPALWGSARQVGGTAQMLWPCVACGEDAPRPPTHPPTRRPSRPPTLPPIPLYRPTPNPSFHLLPLCLLPCLPTVHRRHAVRAPAARAAASRGAAGAGLACVALPPAWACAGTLLHRAVTGPGWLRVHLALCSPAAGSRRWHREQRLFGVGLPVTACTPSLAASRSTAHPPRPGGRCSCETRSTCWRLRTARSWR